MKTFDVLDHAAFMRQAIVLAGNNPRYPFGALIVDRETEQVVAAGYNRSRDNPTWHGEMDAINRLIERGHRGDRLNLVLYTTAEPCGMCQSAIIWTGLGAVVYGTSITTLQEMGWNQIAIRAADVIRAAPFSDCKLIGGVEEAACDRLFVEALRLSDE